MNGPSLPNHLFIVAAQSGTVINDIVTEKEVKDETDHRYKFIFASMVDLFGWPRGQTSASKRSTGAQTRLVQTRFWITANSPLRSCPIQSHVSDSAKFFGRLKDYLARPSYPRPAAQRSP